MDVAVIIASWVWLAVEIGLRARDRLRGTGGAGRDAHTRLLIVVTVAPVVVVSAVLAGLLPPGGPLDLPGRGVACTVAGLVLMIAGLALRLWAVVVLGEAFRTTVEVDADQAVVDRGPYRVLRHPSYAGALLVVVGFGIGAGTWVSLALCLLVPVVAFTRRILVEERVLGAAMGAPYRNYARRTRRLVPGLW